MIETFVVIVTLVIVLVSIYMLYSSQFEEVVFVKSKINNKKYLVQNKKDRKEAADILASVSMRLNKLVDFLRNKYPDNPDVLRLKQRFNANHITESTYKNKYTSYSVNKGEKIVFCLRSRDEKQKLVELNTLMFVALHEITHIMTKSIGHTEEFWRNFKFILQESVELGIYTRDEYSKNPKKYCGIEITHSPLE